MTTMLCSSRVRQILALRARAAAVRAAYEQSLTRLAPLRHHAQSLVLQSRALKSRLGAAELQQLRRAWGGA